MVMEGLNLRASGSSWLTKQSVVEHADKFWRNGNYFGFALFERVVVDDGALMALWKIGNKLNSNF